MAISVNTVYQRVLGILNKEQRGYVTAQEFNLFANQAQQDLFEQYFYDINQFGRVPGNSTGYSDMLTLLNEKINIFETIGTPTRPSSYFVAPGDVYRLGSIVYKNTTTNSFGVSSTEQIEAERINANEFLYINSSPLTKPTNTRPVFTSNTNGIKVYGNSEITDVFFNQKASFLARLGSGSACRSIEGDLIVWGKHKEITGSSDLFGVKYPFKVHDNFKNYQDTILLVDKGEKEVSSTVGHDLMHNHPFAEQRFAQAHENLSKLINIFREGDLKSFIEIIESEALTLHGMMMTSMPYFILMKPNTLEIINKIWNFRQETGLHICFTLDAGANVHILYPESEAKAIYEFISSELVVYCQNGHYICDRIGFGAKQLPI